VETDNKGLLETIQGDNWWIDDLPGTAAGSATATDAKRLRDLIKTVAAGTFHGQVSGIASTFTPSTPALSQLFPTHTHNPYRTHILLIGTDLPLHKMQPGMVATVMLVTFSVLNGHTTLKDAEKENTMKSSHAMWRKLRSTFIRMITDNYRHPKLTYASDTNDEESDLEWEGGHHLGWGAAVTLPQLPAPEQEYDSPPPSSSRSRPTGAGAGGTCCPAVACCRFIACICHFAATS